MKTVIVTGASGNMGQAVVKKFLLEGFKVVATVVPNDPVVFDPEDKGLDIVTVDLMSESDTAQFVLSVIEKYKSIDAVVLTVGGFAMGSMKDTGSADIYKQYKLNFETAYHVVRPVFEKMMEQKKGRIFMIGSKPGLNARFGKGMVAYGLSKSLIFRLAELLNEEAKGTNVITTVIVPSTIDTPQNRKSMPHVDFKTWVKPESIADSIYFYCTETAVALREPVLKLYNNA